MRELYFNPVTVFILVFAVGDLIAFFDPPDLENVMSFFRGNRVLKPRRGGNQRLEEELYTSVITLKNIAIAQEDNPLSSGVIFEKLLSTSRRLKPVYSTMIAMYNQGDMTRAFEYFAETVGTRNARTFALTLEKTDRINPSELKEQVIALSETMAEERYTKGMEKAQSRGTLIYTLATAVCFIVLINFVFVCVFMDTMSMLGDFI